MTQAFNKSNQLLTGVIFESINTYDTFNHIKSFLSGAWYNFIVPSVEREKLDQKMVDEIIRQETSRSFELSYYIRDNLLDSYQQHFAEHGNEGLGSECYMFGENKQDNDIPGDFIETKQEDVGRCIEMGETYFPGWENQEEYTRYFFKLQAQGKDDPLAKNYLYRIKGHDVGSTGIVISRKHSLAYIHNTGVLPEFRRRGYFTNMVRHISNIALSHGAAESYALVEGGEASYHGLLKLGFKLRNKYHLFATNSPK